MFLTQITKKIYNSYLTENITEFPTLAYKCRVYVRSF